MLMSIWAFAFSAVAQEEKSAEQLLQEMQAAYQTLNFELTFIEVSQGHLEPKLLTRGHLDGQVMTHLTHLNGRPREFVQRNNETSFFDANQGGYTLEGANLPGLFYRLQTTSLANLLERYDAVSAGRSRVLGRVAQIVRLVPKSKSYYGYMLWLDQDTGLLLKLDTLNEGTEVVEQSMGVALNVTEQPSPLIAELKDASLPAVMTTADIYPALPQASPWHLDWVPEGFSIRAQDKHKLPVTEQPVDYVMLSNGLVDVSVYVRKNRANSDSQQQLIRQGATHLLTMMNPARVEVTVVGAIPADTAHKLAESVELSTTP